MQINNRNADRHTPKYTKTALPYHENAQISQGVLILIYNMKVDGIEANGFKYLNNFFQQIGISQLGIHPDTTYLWFASVGTKIFTQCITQSTVPNVTMLTKWPLEVIKQNVLKNHQLTQKKLNKLFEVRFDISAGMCKQIARKRNDRRTIGTGKRNAKKN